jgi:phage terminase small subunit
MKEHKQPSKLTRAQLTQALDSVPVSHILGKTVSRELTPKQRTFALEVAKGSTGAAAYRKAYSPKGKPKTHGDNASRLKGDERIQAEIQAIQLAIKAQEYQTPAALRALVIQSLVGVITNPDSQPGQITAAAKVLGTVTEVAAFTERKEVRTITSSEDARAKIMAELKQLANADAVDVVVNDDADSLLAELAFSAESETHPYPTPQAGDAESPADIHTIPHERSTPYTDSAATPTGPSTNFPDADPTPSPQDDPPSPDWK